MAARARAGVAALSHLVRSAGGLLSRSAHGRVEVLLVHRPKYDDWSIPKGKANARESDEDCALREVEEETGVRAELLWELPTTRYVDSAGNPKQARYWAMRPVDGEAGAHAEVDDVRWLRPADALALLSYDRDRPVVQAFGHDGRERLLLVRHAEAGDRDEWPGDDSLRPLDERGRLQADRLLLALSGHPIGRVLSSPYARCVQTVEPVAAQRGLRVETRAELTEGRHADEVLRVATETGAGVLCLHGEPLEELVGHPVEKGATVVAELANGAFTEIAELPPPA